MVSYLKVLKITFYFFLFTFTFCKAQNLQGLSGLFFIPTADLNNDGTLTIGTNFVNREVISFGGFNEDALTPYITLNYLPFAEFSLRITRLLNSKVTTQGIGDRTISARVRFLEEQNYLPALLIGFHDMTAVYGGSGAVHNNSLYLVASKNIPVSNWLNLISIHLGYGTDKIKARTHHFVGLFGGLSFTFFNTLELMGEYDAERFNAGLRLTLFNHIKLLGGFMDMKHLSGGAAVSFQL